MSPQTSDDPRDGFFNWMADQVLAWLQARCEHPGMMVAVDILEGCGGDVSVSYCRRCGSVKTVWNKQTVHGPQFRNTWRPPDPNLWRGR